MSNTPLRCKGYRQQKGDLMKLATTTGDFHGYSNNLAETLIFFEGTGFKLFDMSFFYTALPGSPFTQPGDSWKKSVEEVAETAEKYGFGFCQAHSPDGEHFIPCERRDRLIPAIRNSIEACAMLGIKQTVVHAGSSPFFSTAEFMQRNKEFYSLFFDDMEKHEVNVLIENGMPVKNSLSTAVEMCEFLDYVNHPLLHACWDTGHANVRKTEQYESIKLLGDHLYAVHINDNFGINDNHIVPFSGKCNFDEVIQGLLDINFKGAFAFEVATTLNSNRKNWTHNGEEINRLVKVPFHLRHQSVSLVYQIGKYMLEQYDCFEE